MAHRLLTPPVRRMEGRARLPLVQHPTEAVVDQLRASMMTRDALRRTPTSGTRKALGPLTAVQRFTQTGAGGTNTPPNMETGLLKRNAPRAGGFGRGAGAGI